MDGANLRQVVLEIVNEQSQEHNSLQAVTVLREARKRLDFHSLEEEQALLTFFYDLIRSGVMAWGYNLSNTGPPFLHLTAQGRESLKHLSGDPMNRDGYLARINLLEKRNPIAWSYITEAVESFTACCYKATAVMLGASAEAQVLELQNSIVNRLNETGAVIPKKLKHWNIKTIRDGITQEIDKRETDLPHRLRELYNEFWLSVTGSMRTTRNDAGHPKSVEPVLQSDVHAGLILFPHLVELVKELKEWVNTNFT